MPISAIYFASPGWLWPAAALGAAAAVFVTWSYRVPVGPPRFRLAAALLKLAGFTGLLLCLLEPMHTASQVKPGANLLVLAADNSLSMNLRGRGETESRGATLKRYVSGERNLWRTALAGNFSMRNYLFDSRLQATEDFRELSFTGRSTALSKALQSVAERIHGEPCAGIFLLTDGIVPEFDLAAAAGLPPVYPVIFGGSLPPRDLALRNPAVSQTSFEDAPVTVQAEAVTAGMRGEEILGRLYPLEAALPGAVVKPVAEQLLTMPADSDQAVFRFQFRPEKTGVLFYRLRAAARREWDASEQDSTEATLANNELAIVVDRGAGPYRVLYVSGRPNWEYKFLHRALESDEQTQLAGLIRIARREPKFDFRGRAGESSNPLFRGFGNQSKEDTESYDRPVMVRLNAVDEFELRDGFPKKAEELFKYRAVIIGDLEAEFFTADQMTLLQRFVSERGGGLLMLGGMESFAEGRYARTPLGDLLPIYLPGPGAAPEQAAESGALHLELTRDGWLQPWVRLRSTEAAEQARLSALPGFDTLNRTGEVKPAASVLATVSDGRRSYPALVSQRFGRGRSAALLLGDLWQSGLGEEARQKDLGKAWRQLVRWLVADVPEQFELHAEPQPGGESVKLQVRLRDAKFQPVENARVALKVQPLGEAPVTVSAEPAAEEPGLYEASYLPRSNGGYRVEASAAAESGAVLGSATAGWATNLSLEEFQTLAPNLPLLEALAQRTGGQVLRPQQLADFARQLPQKRAPVVEIRTSPLWPTPPVFLLALACLLAEWGLRRGKGLA